MFLFGTPLENGSSQNKDQISKGKPNRKSKLTFSHTLRMRQVIEQRQIKYSLKASLIKLACTQIFFHKKLICIKKRLRNSLSINCVVCEIILPNNLLIPVNVISTSSNQLPNLIKPIQAHCMLIQTFFYWLFPCFFVFFVSKHAMHQKLSYF